MRLDLVLGLACALLGSAYAAGDADGHNSGPDAQILRLNKGEQVRPFIQPVGSLCQPARAAKPGSRLSPAA